MESFFTWLETVPVLGILALLALVILFGQSGLDKVSDWKGNLEWLTGHFSKSLLKGTVPLLLVIITGLELLTAFTGLIGLGIFFYDGGTAWAKLSILLAFLSLLCLFAGQRIAKDYPGAGTLAVYMGLVILSYLLW